MIRELCVRDNRDKWTCDINGTGRLHLNAFSHMESSATKTIMSSPIVYKVIYTRKQR